MKLFKLKLDFDGKPVEKCKFDKIDEIDNIVEGLKKKFR